MLYLVTDDKQIGNRLYIITTNAYEIMPPDLSTVMVVNSVSSSSYWVIFLKGIWDLAA